MQDAVSVAALMKYLVHENAKREQAEFDLQTFSCDVCYSDKPVSAAASNERAC